MSIEYDPTRIDYPENPLPQLPSAAEIGEIIGLPPADWHGRCHAVAHAMVLAGVVPHGRVARGGCQGVPSQHSWIVGPTADGQLGDCYADNAVIIDPTLHLYRGDVTGIYAAHADVDGWHSPRGKGPHIMGLGRPARPADGSHPISLDSRAFDELSPEAKWWVTEQLGPLDRMGWSTLTASTMIGWPSDEIVRAMALTRRLGGLVPIDVRGMLTNLDPGRMYLHPDDVDRAVAAERFAATEATG